MGPDLTRRTILALAGGATVTVGAVSAITVSRIAAGQVPSLDMFSPYRDGVRSDVPLLNSILNGHNVCVVKPGGPIFVSGQPITIPQNALLRSEGGRQRVRIVRDVNYNGDTVQMGTPVGLGAGSAAIEGFWFDHPGRFVGRVPDTYSLTNRLTGDQAHIRAYGVQGARVVDCGGWGMPHFLIHAGGTGLDVVRLFIIGGMWNPRIAAQQESVSILRSMYDPLHGYPVNCTIESPNFIGGNTAASSYAVPLDNKTYTVAHPRIGPKYGFLMNAFEVFKVIGGFSGGFALANFHYEGGGPELIGGSPAHVMIRSEVLLHSIDESMGAGAEFIRTGDAQAVVSGADFINCNWNGQLVCARAISTSINGKFAVANLVVDGGTMSAYQGGGALLYAVDGGLIAPRRLRGYNNVGANTVSGDLLATGAGILLGDVTRNVRIGPTVFGGGTSLDNAANSCQWGLGDTTLGQGNRYFGLDSVNLGLAGGGPVVGGTRFTP